MKEEKNNKLCDVYSKLAAGWLDLSQLIETYEGKDIAPLKKAKKKMQRGLDLILSVLPGEEEHDKRR